MKKKTAPQTPPVEMAFETAAFKATAIIIPTAVNENNDGSPVNENDDLYNELERRYGGGYAQAIVEGLKKSQKN